MRDAVLAMNPISLNVLCGREKKSIGIVDEIVKAITTRFSDCFQCSLHLTDANNSIQNRQNSNDITWLLMVLFVL